MIPIAPLVFHRNGIPIRRWRTAWRTACQVAGVPTRFLHDCRRTAARTLPAPDVRRHATLPQSWIQRENWEFETHRRPSPDGIGRRRRRNSQITPPLSSRNRGPQTGVSALDIPGATVSAAARRTAPPTVRRGGRSCTASARHSCHRRGTCARRSRPASRRCHLGQVGAGHTPNAELLCHTASGRRSGTGRARL